MVKNMRILNKIMKVMKDDKYDDDDALKDEKNNNEDCSRKYDDVEDIEQDDDATVKDYGDEV